MYICIGNYKSLVYLPYFHWINKSNQVLMKLATLPQFLAAYEAATVYYLLMVVWLWVSFITTAVRQHLLLPTYIFGLLFVLVYIQSVLRLLIFFCYDFSHYFLLLLLLLLLFIFVYINFLGLLKVNKFVYLFVYLSMVGWLRR